MSNKIGFWAVFALVISSQICSGVFMLPISHAPYGAYSLISWMISGAGAVSLALVFATLCAKFPETGGPHVYVKHTFGPAAAFFVGWTSWVISGVSTTALIVVGVGYLTPFFHEDIKSMRLFLELLLFTIITLINLRGIATAGHVEFLLTVVKVAVLLAIPVAALFFFDRNNFIISEEILSLTTSQILARSTLLTLWCFIGLELATAPAGSVDNPAKTIPKAVVLGTVCVAVIYFINNFAIMGLINGNNLASSRAPYVDAIKIMFSGNWHLIVSIVAFIFCVGSLNAWVLSSGQVAFGLAEDRLMPKFFAKRNKYGSPFGE